MLTGVQMRMARGCLRWSVKDLSEASGVSSATIKRMEEVDGVPNSLADNLGRVVAAIEKQGVALLWDDGAGPGVRFKATRG